MVKENLEGRVDEIQRTEFGPRNIIVKSLQNGIGLVDLALTLHPLGRNNSDGLARVIISVCLERTGSDVWPTTRQILYTRDFLGDEEAIGNYLEMSKKLNSGDYSLKLSLAPASSITFY